MSNADHPGSAGGRRACAYVRVSTARQAEHETSLADQVAAIERYCGGQGIELVEVYREPGASATDDHRAAFQAMIAAACDRGHPYDLVIVHSFSRFFRDQFEFERYRRRLARSGVRIVSITQDVGEGPTADLVRSILNRFDEYQSQENAKHVSRAMAANARDGFWNGSRPPLGYRTVIAEQRGDKAKKKLAVEPAEALLVQRVFDLYLRGDGQSGPLGIKAIVSWLNGRGERYRGKPFHKSNVDALLRRTAYAGTAWFNRRCARTGVLRPRDAWVAVPVPPLVDAADFDAVQRRLAARNPRRMPPRVVTGPTLLIGLARCHCGAALTIRTGKSGRYRYYACARRAAQGVTGCAGQSIRMEVLDNVVMRTIAQRLLQPLRLGEFLRHCLLRTADEHDRKRQALTRLRSERTHAEGAIHRLYALVEQGLASPADAGFAARLKDNRYRLVQLDAEIIRAERALDRCDRTITPTIVERFGRLLRQRLDDLPALRQGYARLFLKRVTIEEGAIVIADTLMAAAAA